MRIAPIFIAIFVIFVLNIVPSLAFDSNIYVDIPAKVLLYEPTKEAEVAYEIPVEVKLLGFTEDKNWYKIKVAYDLFMLGHYEYTGWCYIPIGKLLEEKAPIKTSETK